MKAQLYGKAELAKKKNETAQKFIDAEKEIEKGKADILNNKKIQNGWK